MRRQLAPTTRQWVLGKVSSLPAVRTGWSSSASKNVTDGKFEFKRRLDFKATGSYSVKAKFYGRVSSCLLSSLSLQGSPGPVET